MKPQVEIKIGSDFRTLLAQEKSTIVKEKVKACMEKLQKPFCENAFENAFSQSPQSRMTMAGIDFKIRWE